MSWCRCPRLEALLPFVDLRLGVCGRFRHGALPLDDPRGRWRARIPNLDRFGAPARSVRPIAPLGDDALGAERARVTEDGLAVAIKVLGKRGNAGTRRQSLDYLSALGYRVFCQNRSDPLKCFLRRRLRRHPFADDVSLGSAPNLLGSHLGKPGVEGRVIRHCRL
jgi:hypothetical protein